MLSDNDIDDVTKITGDISEDCRSVQVSGKTEAKAKAEVEVDGSAQEGCASEEAGESDRP